MSAQVVEVVAEFDYQSLPENSRIVVQQKWSEIESLLRVRTQNAIEIGYRLVDIKKELGHGHWRKWCETVLPFSHDTADRWIKLAEAHAQMPQIATFDLSAAYVLSGADESTIAQIAPETPHKQVKQQLEFQPGSRYIVAEPTNEFHGQTVTVQKREGDFVYCETSQGVQPMLFGWLSSEDKPETEKKPQAPSKSVLSELLESTNIALEVARERSRLLQEFCQKLCQRVEIPEDLRIEAIELGLI